MALNLHCFPGDACEPGEETDLFVVGPIFRAIFSMSMQMRPAELTSAIVLKK